MKGNCEGEGGGGWKGKGSGRGERIGAALVAFGFPALGTATAEFTQPNRIATLGRPPLRIDVMTSIDGVTFAEAWEERLEARFGEQTVAFLGKRLLIQNKLATGRAKDRLDVELLREGSEEWIRRVKVKGNREGEGIGGSEGEDERDVKVKEAEG